ncbi:Gag-Pol polyprotein [Vulpes lagopus]
MQMPPGTWMAAVSSRRNQICGGSITLDRPCQSPPNTMMLTYTGSNTYDPMLAWLVEDHRLRHHPARGTRTGSHIQNASSTHMGTRKMEDLIRHAKITIKDFQATIEQIMVSCHACQLTNATAHGSNLGTWLPGDRPGAYWEVDFTEIKPGKYGYRYLLVFVDTFSGWTEASSHQTGNSTDHDQETAGRHLTEVWFSC